jgi:hypothetical protein
MVARAPAGLIAAPGAVRLQAWTRDPGGIGQSSLSDALRVQVVP